VINIDKALTIDGWMYPMHLEWLAQQAATRMNIIELGSWVGRSTRAICDNTTGLVWAVDMWAEKDPFPNAELAYNMFLTNLADQISIAKLAIIRMSTDDAYEKYFKPNFGFPYFDMVFIDANHTYEYVKRDILNYQTLLRPGGLLCGHDLNHEGVAKAVDEIFGADYRALEYLWWVTI
jgi:predicted O-methyltransferase YrrM